MARSPRGQRADFSVRIPEMGRIRIGVRQGGAPKGIDTFRFTSVDEVAIRQIAVLYGGTPQAWDEPSAAIRNQWQVITEASVIEVVIPPDAASVWYETWTRAGIGRRCDGVTCTDFSGPEPRAVPCLCEAADVLICKPKIRISVMLTNVSFGGTWRLESGGHQARAELPAMADLIGKLAAGSPSGLVLARLGVKRVTRNSKHYVVPYLSAGRSMIDMLEGRGDVTSLTTRGRPVMALDAGDAEIVDAEIMEDDMNPKEAQSHIEATYLADMDVVMADLYESAQTVRRLAGVAMTDEAFLDWLTANRSANQITSHLELSDERKRKLLDTLEQIRSDALRIQVSGGQPVRIVRHEAPPASS